MVAIILKSSSTCGTAELPGSEEQIQEAHISACVHVACQAQEGVPNSVVIPHAVHTFHWEVPE
jgi:hypothetical protein